jgi:DNA-binding transcriptional MerR regulator
MLDHSEEKDDRRIYFTVGDVAEELDVDPHRIRYWSNEIDEVDPRTTSGGTRQYSREDVDCLRRIYELVENEKYTLEGAERKLGGEDLDPDRRDHVRSIIEECEDGLEDIVNQVEEL